jgi:2C-methyl-D-erythritol 2,4-cyclodiphosphate synthase
MIVEKDFKDIKNIKFFTNNDKYNFIIFYYDEKSKTYVEIETKKNNNENIYTITDLKISIIIINEKYIAKISIINDNITIIIDKKHSNMITINEKINILGNQKQVAEDTLILLIKNIRDYLKNKISFVIKSLKIKPEIREKISQLISNL